MAGSSTYRWIDLANDDGVYPQCDCGAEDATIIVASCADPDCEYCDLPHQLVGSLFQCPACYVRENLSQLGLPSRVVLKYGEFIKVPEPGAEEVR